MMNKLQIDNLKEIIKLNYSHICFNVTDLSQLTIIPAMKEQFYPTIYKKSYREGKWGFFNNGQVMCWVDWRMESGNIKISPTHMPSDLSQGWSDVFSFKEEGSPMQIYKLMKMRAFW